jgi:hypothetical protein
MRRERGAGSGEDCDADGIDSDGDREVSFVDSAEYSVDADGEIVRDIQQAQKLRFFGAFGG